MSRALPKVLCGLCLILWYAPALAGDRGPVVIELYTSQGCSSCPPADAMIAELAERDEVLPLALHVDYWDYIGWVDSFANPAYTQRQKAYARSIGSRTIYTPQIVVGGTDHVVGLKPMQIERLIQKHDDAAAPVDLAVARLTEGLSIAVEPGDGPLADRMLIQLVRFDPTETVSIEHGENAGMTIDYANIVTDWTVVDTWDGKGRYDTVLSTVGGPAAVIVQEAGPGAILAVARVD